MKHREGLGLCQVKKRLSMSRQEKNEGGDIYKTCKYRM